MTREEIKSYLDDGDYIKIARQCAAKGRPTTRHYVGEVINGTRNCKKGTGKLIIEEAEEIALSNKQLIEHIEIGKELQDIK
jgi:hypothetical protein